MDEPKRTATWAECEEEEKALDRAMMVAVQQEIFGMQHVVRVEEQEQDPLGILHQHEFMSLERKAKASRHYQYMRLDSPDFRPSVFLNHFHQKSTAEQLQRGSKLLGERVKTGDEQVKALVEENFGTFVTCKDQIDSVYGEFSTHHFDCEPEQSFIHGLRSDFQKVEDKMNVVYGDLLVRKREIESKRGVLSVLLRFQFVFKLVGVLKEAIDKNEYDKAIRDYRKAKLLVGNSHHDIFQRILTEVEKIIQELKKELYSKLDNPSVSTEEKEKIIGYLVELDPESQPIWFYVDAQHRNVINNLESQLASFQKAKEGVAAWFEDQQKSNRVWRDLQTSSTLQSLISTSEPEELESLALDAYDMLDAQIAKHIRKYTACFLQDAGDFWKLVQSARSGEHGKGTFHASPENINKANSMISTVVQSYTSHLHQLFFSSETTQAPEDEEDSFEIMINKIRARQGLKPFMKEVIRDVCKCQRVVQGWGLLHFTYQQFSKSISELVSFYIQQTCIKTIEDIRKLPSLSLDPDGKELLTVDDCPATKVQQQFVAAMTEALKLVHDLVDQKDPLQAHIETFFFEALAVYLDCLHYMAFDFNHEDFCAKRGEARFSELFLLTVLQCASHARTHDFPSLVSKYVEKFGPLSKERVKASEALTKNIESMILSSYIARKSVLQGRRIRQGLLLSGMDWNSAAEPSEIRSYVPEFLVDMVFIHAHAYRVATDHTNMIMSRLTENAVQSIYDSFKSVDSIGTFSALQLKIEIEAIAKTLEAFATPLLTSLLSAVTHYLDWLATGGAQGTAAVPQRTLDVTRFRLLEDFQKKNRLQFSCFQRS
eukprot:TRINITY_DN6440_c0_g1_i3.p1 TRINITY_DN6440_c0_g1~~TRINITY_DN6440_c0_g1_i3.p1  ORF type:complete len:826 (-),score=173.09 TRINITY_DN6440_c0_g1_i3:102-2579(-)